MCVIKNITFLLRTHYKSVKIMSLLCRAFVTFMSQQYQNSVTFMSHVGKITKLLRTFHMNFSTFVQGRPDKRLSVNADESYNMSSRLPCRYSLISCRIESPLSRYSTVPYEPFTIWVCGGTCPMSAPYMTGTPMPPRPHSKASINVKSNWSE